MECYLNVINRNFNIYCINILCQSTYFCRVKIEEAIQQKKFVSPYQKAMLNLIYTSGLLASHNIRLLKPYNLSPQQFNILRILRGMHPETATIKLLTERMLDKMSNASRLVEKLKSKGLVQRVECANDRRRVDISITEEGLKLINAASVVLEEDMQASASGLSEEEAILLNDLLDKMRNSSSFADEK